MIGLVLAALRSRPVQALTVALLGAFLVACAVAVPVYVGAADHAVIANEWAATGVDGRTVRSLHGNDQATETTRDLSYEQTVPRKLAQPGFSTVFAAQADIDINAGGVEIDPQFVFREGVCEHLVIVAGRCPLASGEILLGQTTANRLKLHAGDSVPIQNAIAVSDGGQAGPLQPNPDEPPMTVAVVGVFTVKNQTEVYWADQPYFLPGGDNRKTDEPVFTTRGTLDALGHTRETQSVDAFLDPSLLTPAGLPRLRAELATMAKVTDPGPQTAIPDLLDRIDRGRRALRQVVPLAEVPLLALGWLLLYFAVAYAGTERRAEIGVVKLRGAGWIRRWWLALGDNGIAVIAGGAGGYLLGFAIVWLASRRLLGSAAAVALPGDAWRYGAAALAAGLLAVVLASRGTFTGAVVDLLRRVPSRGARWQAATAEAVLLALAVVAVVEIRGSDRSGLTGIMIFAPGLVLLVVGLLAARLVVPLAAVLGRRAVRRGKLARGLGALQLARRPGGARLVTVLVVALAELLFATGAVDVAGQARAERVGVSLGAPTVLDIGAATPAAVLSATHAVDPAGRYAMAVRTVPPAAETDPPLLAVDSPRLAAVASWWSDYGPLSPAQVAARLRPTPPAPVVIKAQQINADVTRLTGGSNIKLELYAAIVTLDDTFAQGVDMGPVGLGRSRLSAEIAACDTGCRLVALGLVTEQHSGDPQGSVRFNSLTQGTPARPLASGLTDAGRWRSMQQGSFDPGTTVHQDAAGLVVTFNATSNSAVRVAPADSPYPLPVVSTSSLTHPTLGNLGGVTLQVTGAGVSHTLPRVGRSGALVDYTYLDTVAVSTDDASGAQVWLAADAPADIPQRLAKAGLTIRGVHRASADLDHLNRQGPGAGLRFHLLAGLLGLLLAIGGLALVATVDQRRGPELWTLRTQGLPARTIVRAGLSAYLTLAFAAVLLAPVAAAAAWWSSGASIPIFIDNQDLVPPPAWPRPGPVLWVWLAAGLVLLVAAGITGYGRRRPGFDGGTRRRQVNRGAGGDNRFGDTATPGEDGRVGAGEPARAGRR